MIIYFNNKFSNNKNILIDVRDRGFLFGDAIFETILFNNQKIILFNYHYERFIKSIKKNYFNFSISKKKLEDIIYRLIGGLRSSMGYLGSKQIKYLRDKPKFVKITKAGFYESMVHNVDIVKSDNKY